MNEKHCETCSCFTEYKLASGHVSALLKLREAVRHYGRNSIHIQNEMHAVSSDCPFKLSDSEHSNMSYLAAHGLAVPDEDRERAGYWLITKKGGEFLRGEIQIPQIAIGRHPVGHTGRLVHIDDFKGEVPVFFEEPVREKVGVQQASFL